MSVPEHNIGADIWGRGDSEPHNFPPDPPAGPRPIDTFLEALTRAGCDWKAHPYDHGKWKARCPAHDDENPSLDIKEGSDGRVLMICRAHCPNERIIDRLGLEWPDLFVSPAPRAKNNKKSPKIDWVAE